MASLTRMKNANKKIEEAILILKEDILDIPSLILHLVENRNWLRSEIRWEESKKKSKASVDEVKVFLEGILDNTNAHKFKMPVNVGKRPIQKEQGNKQKPRDYEGTPDYMFADEINYKYPLDTFERIQAARQNWNKSLYNEKEQLYIKTRIETACDHFKANGKKENFSYVDIYRK